MMLPVSITHEGPVTHVQLDRAEKLNAFSAELVHGLMQAAQAAQSDGTRLLIFSGAGKGFSGGFDLSDLDQQSDGDLLLRFVRVEELLQAVYHAPFATLALVHGACYGAAADLVAACHFRIAAPGARFRMPGLQFGLVLGTRRLSRLVGADNARALLLRQEPFDAAEAAKVGFIQEITEPDEWQDVQARILTNVSGLTEQAFASLVSRTTDDQTDSDLAALVRSAAEGSVRERIRAYLKARR